MLMTKKKILESYQRTRMRWSWEGKDLLSLSRKRNRERKAEETWICVSDILALTDFIKLSVLEIESYSEIYPCKLLQWLLYYFIYKQFLISFGWSDSSLSLSQSLYIILFAKYFSKVTSNINACKRLKSNLI